MALIVVAPDLAALAVYIVPTWRNRAWLWMLTGRWVA